MLARVEDVFRSASDTSSWITWGPARMVGRTLSQPIVLAWTRDFFSRRDLDPAVSRHVVIGIAMGRRFSMPTVDGVEADDAVIDLVDADGVPDEAIASAFATRARSSSQKIRWHDRLHAVLRRAAAMPWN